MTAPPVPLNTRVLARMRDAAGYVHWAVSHFFQAHGQREYLAPPWCRVRERDPVVMEWWPLPALDDPRWRAGEPSGGVEDEPILISYGRGADGVYEDTYKSDRRLSFPGFAGGPRYRFEGVKAWMPISELGEGHLVHKDVIDALTPTELQIRKQQERISRLADELTLAILNDGDFYRQHIKPLRDGQRVRHHRYLVSFQQWDDPKRRSLLRCRVYEAISLHLGRNPDLLSEPYHIAIRHDFVTEAARNVLDHHYRAWKEAQR